MSKFIDYNKLLDDAKNLIEQKTTVVFKKIGTNLMSRDFVHLNMPLCDVRLRAADPEALAGQNYYTPVQVEFEVAAIDLSSQDEAARIVNDIVAECQRAFVENAHFSATWDSVLLGHVDFMAAENEQGGFAASVVAAVTINVYSDQ